MGVLAVIPARGGSKGVPRKNVRLLCGKPLIAWTIEAALEAQRVSRVVVSTDDVEIAEISQRFGAEVVWRPKEMGGDDSLSETALLHVIDVLNERKRDGLALLQCTSPLMRSDDIDGVLHRLDRADSVFTAVPWTRFIWEDIGDAVTAIGHDKEFRPMRQTIMNRQLLEVGAVYGMKMEGFLRTRHRFFGRTVHYPVAPEMAIEIDEETDFFLVEQLMRRRIARNKAAFLPQNLQAMVLDFDGVLTDNGVAVSSDGQESAHCHRGDGWAIQMLKNRGIRVVVLTNETNPLVVHRCNKLNIPCISVQGDKLPALTDWLHNNQVEASSTIYVGNDEPDVPAMMYVGCGVAPADAYPAAQRAAQIVLDTPGGRGCIRELTQLIVDPEGGVS